MLIQQIPAFSGDKEDAARRFINLVDEFYDRNVKLITTAEVAPEALYRGDPVCALNLTEPCPDFRKCGRRNTSARSIDREGYPAK